MEKWEERKDLVFPHVCLVGEVKKWEVGKHFCFIENKSGTMKQKWDDRKCSLYKLTIISLLHNM